MLCNLGAEAAIDVSGLLIDEVRAGREGEGAAERRGLGFVFGRAVSLLTRTEAGIIAVSSGVCCANGLFTTVDAADFT